MNETLSEKHIRYRVHKWYKKNPPLPPSIIPVNLNALISLWFPSLLTLFHTRGYYRLFDVWFLSFRRLKEKFLV